MAAVQPSTIHQSQTSGPFEVSSLSCRSEIDHTLIAEDRSSTQTRAQCPDPATLHEEKTGAQEGRQEINSFHLSQVRSEHLSSKREGPHGPQSRVDRSRRQGLEDRVSWLARSDDLDLDPPVTQETLKVLELSRMISDPRLRHDLCFDENIEFKPATECPHGCTQSRKGQHYYEALYFELATLLSSRTQPVPREGLVRLPRMFESIRQMLRGLCPRIEWSAIDEQLDADLLMQQIQHSVLDLAKLGEWLCQLLIRSCAPLRDDFIKGIRSHLKEASMNNSAESLLNGIKRLFGAIELMRLDVANHQIRSLQAVMVDDYVVFGQKHAANAVESGRHGGDLASAANWFTTQRHDMVCPATQSPLSALELFAYGVVDIVIQRESYIPPTFKFDFSRLTNLRCDFQHMVFRTAVKHVFDNLLSRFEGCNAIDPGEYRRSLSELQGLTENPAAQQKFVCFWRGLEYSDCIPDHMFRAFTREMSSAVAQSAHRLFKIGDELCEHTIADVESSLIDWQDAEMSPMAEERLTLEHELTTSVAREIQPLLKLTPVQIRARIKALNDDLKGPIEQQTLLRMSRDIAHVSILHWRVWGPTLYEPWVQARNETNGALPAQVHRLDVSGG